MPLAGRGWGKTRVGAEVVRLWVKDFEYVNIIGATVDDARDIMIEGESGIMAVCPRSERPIYRGYARKLIWPNGASSLIFTADEPERLRGKQHMKIWADEIAAWRYPEAWDQAKFGLRIGPRPQAIITTTPRPSLLIKELVADPSCIVTRGTTYDNRLNLAPSFYAQIIKKYENTRLGRQELMAEILDDNPRALFKRKDIDKARSPIDTPNWRRIVVAIDPAVSSTEVSDECGIVVAAVAEWHGSDHFFILYDGSDILSPNEWSVRAVALFHKFECDRIVAEVNNGGDLVEMAIRTIDNNVSYSKVHATRGKVIRAEPIAALYEQGRVHHMGTFSKLEDQMCEFDPLLLTQKSPDRMDALVWALTELMTPVEETKVVIRDFRF